MKRLKHWQSFWSIVFAATRVTPRLELSVAGENLLQPYQVEFASDPGPNVAIRRGAYGKFVWKTED